MRTSGLVTKENRAQPSDNCPGPSTQGYARLALDLGLFKAQQLCSPNIKQQSREEKGNSHGVK